MSQELEMVKKACDDEAKERQSLMGRFRNLEHEFDGRKNVSEMDIDFGC